ncbi:CBS domain-containing protein [Shewanella sp. 10N.286.51.B8]|uniref:CBS domain-containing protein n=1 Tax=Shewanella sp. 10N.286.51.B8 TaxID=3229708 RepID=UPI003552854D
MKTIEHVMSPRVVTVEMDDRITIAKNIFDNMPFHHLVVKDEHNQVAGVLSRKDLFNAISPNLGTAAELTRDIDTLQKRVHQVMSHHPITIGPEITIEQASQILLTEGTTCLPVLKNQQLIGIVSWRDLLSHYCHLGCSAA